MHIMIKNFIFILILTFTGPLFAVEVHGVEISEKISQPETKQILILNGTGIRTKFIFDIYIGALYLPSKSSDPQQIINSPEAKRISMHFLYDHIKKEKMTDGWSDAFAEVADETTLATLLDRIKQFNSYFPDIVEGDVVNIDFIPNTGASVTINNILQGTVAGDDFQKALLAIWFGDSPPNESLKDGMLGIVD